MSRSETDEFLGRHETGVLSLAREAEPYAIPISYGYDADERTFFVRLVSTAGSEKRRFLGGSPRVRLVVYEEAGAGSVYRSVIAGGRLEAVAPEELSVERIEQFGGAKRPLFEIWGESRRDLDIRLYTLDPERLDGRRTEVERDDDG